MENHAGRPEVIDAFAHQTGWSVRHSATVKYDMLYRAFVQAAGPNTRIIRVSRPLTAIQNVIGSLRWTLFGGLLLASALGLALAYAFSRHLSNRVKRVVDFAQELAHGHFPENAFPARGGDEINLLEQGLNEMGARLRGHLDQIVAEKDKSESILWCMVEGVLVLDAKGQVLVINDQARNMFHVPADRKLEGVPIVELSRHPAMRQLLQEVLAFDFTTNRYSKEIELEEGQWFRVNATSLRHEQQVSAECILVFHDITEVKRLETIRSDFVANVSHELRTPLTAIRGYVETLLHAPPQDSAETTSFLEIIDRHAERLSRLTEDLLTLSDLESGKLRIAQQPVDVTQLMQRVLEVFWSRAEGRQIRLAKDLEPGVPAVRGDVDRLQQVFINLIDNALKYTPPGGTVTLRAKIANAGSDGEPRVEIAVSDTGPGIPENHLPRLTERFYRVDKARSRDLGGTGLGLAIVKHIVQAHDGELKIESASQKGTTVRVFLAAAKAPQASVPDSVSEQIPGLRAIS
jgi:two-component system phosphate regulon sensor histidine kinase PhoR